MSSQAPVLIIGAGPAGLTAAQQLTLFKETPLVIEKGHRVGGIARTEVYKGYRFDIGGHRFFTKDERLNALWREMLGEDFIRVPRMSHIFYKGRFYNYPLEARNALMNLGFIESAAVLLSYVRAKLIPIPKEESIEEWVVNRFGRRLFEIFFRSYTEKVWGMPCSQIHADWAAQRIKGLSLKTAVFNAIFGTHQVKTLVTEFLYPILGPGMMWERFQDYVDRHGGTVSLNTNVTQIRLREGRVSSVLTECRGRVEELKPSHVISSMPLRELVEKITPAPPPEVLSAARQLKYRSFLIACLMLDKSDLFPDNWVYVNSADLQLARIQNFGNWSAGMVPVPHKSSLGIEYFCNEGDEIWNMADRDLVALATRELEALGLAGGAKVEDGVVFRQPKAYPVYADDYQRHVEVIRGWLGEIPNLQTIGRNGMHRYNNMDHSMITGIMAAENFTGARHDVWEVNKDQEYHEEGGGSAPPDE